MSRKRLFGLVVSILLGVLALPGTIDDLESWKRWISSVSDWASENPGDVVRTILVLAAILVFIWSWDIVPKIREKIKKSQKPAVLDDLDTDRLLGINNQLQLLSDFELLAVSWVLEEDGMTVERHYDAVLSTGFPVEGCSLIWGKYINKTFDRINSRVTLLEESGGHWRVQASIQPYERVLVAARRPIIG